MKRLPAWLEKALLSHTISHVEGIRGPSKKAKAKLVEMGFMDEGIFGASMTERGAAYLRRHFGR